MKIIDCGMSQSVSYYSAGDNGVYEAKEGELYYYNTYVGKHSIDVEKGDSAWFLSDDKTTISSIKGPVSIDSKYVLTVLRGYMSPEKHIKLDANTNLPYVNGCSTRQLIHAERLGDPTYQLLQIPAGSHEQAHHIHSTTRVVYVLSGFGWSHVGMEGNLEKTRLEPGMVGIFDPMTPHHFETDSDAQEPLIVLPLHICSAHGLDEFNHPMFSGSFLMNQGH
jgi:quercetin dioxygenase-like cupin family protein